MKNPLRDADELFGQEINNDFIDLGFDMPFEQRIDEFLNDYGINMPYEKTRVKEYIEGREIIEVLQDNDCLGVFKIIEKSDISLDSIYLTRLMISLCNDDYVTHVRDPFGYYGYKLTNKGKEFLKLF